MMNLFVISFSFNVSSAPPPLSQLWSDADTIILGLVDTISLINQSDLYTVYDVEVTVAEYLQDSVDGLNVVVRYRDYSTSKMEKSISFEKGERLILFLNSTHSDYYVLVRTQGKFTFRARRYENIYGETIEPPRGDTSALVVGLGVLLLISLTATSLLWLKKRFTPATSQLI